ncbi:MAG: glycosyltransferase family 2 protein [Candidatus Omnitrophota bacterium]
MDRQFLTIVVPVFNEAATIKGVIDKVLTLDFVKEVIVVDDGSTDGTGKVLKETKFEDRVRKFFHETNKGKGAALRTAFKEATGEVIVVQDADLEYDPDELFELTGPIRKGVADVVYGSRLLGGKPQRVHLFWHKMGNAFLSFLTGLLYNTTLSDMETGYKVFRRDAIKDIEIRSNDFSVEPELTAKVFKKKLRVYEMPISYYGRTYAEGKKISWKHGLGAIWALLKFRLTD